MEELNDDWIPVAQAAREADCTTSNVLQALHRGAFEAKPVHISRATMQWRIHRPSFERWLTERHTNSGRKLITTGRRGRLAA